MDILVTNTQSKEFRIEPCYERNEFNLKKFITTYIDTGNSMITERLISLQNFELAGFWLYQI